MADEEIGGWDYCHIELRVRNDVGSAGETGLPALTWAVFMAIAEGPGGRYIAGESRELPLASTVMALDIFPTGKTAALEGMLEDLLTELRSKGWRSLPFRGNKWWERRLRRLYRPRRSFWERLRGRFKRR